MNNNETDRVQFTDNNTFTGIKVFSATLMKDRSSLGESVTAWIGSNPHLTITEVIVTQSSDEAFHCLTMTVCYFDPKEN